MAQTYTGFTSNTPDRLLLDSGAIFLNYDILTDTPSTATAKLLGCTRGGSEFIAKPSIKSIVADGVKGMAKGLQYIESWDVSLKASVLEMTTALLEKALATGTTDTSSNLTYDIVTASNTIALSNYIDNVTFIGTISGSNNPIVIIIYNALCKDGIKLKTKDKDQATVDMTFDGHYDYNDFETPPFKIYYPKMTPDTTPPTVTVLPIDGATGTAVTANFVWTFSEAIQSSCVTGGNFFVVKASDGTAVGGSLSINTDKTIVTFDPTSSLAGTTAYIATATTNVKDIAGNSLAANSITNFTTV